MDEPEFYECGSVEGDEVYRVVRSFYLIVKAGPPVSIPVGSTVRLRPDSARMNFPHRVLPIDLPDPGRYEAIEKFQHVNAEGYWEFIHPGDILQLSISEALPLLRDFKVKIQKEEVKEK